MATALDLPTIDTLRHEQRAVRAVLARLRRRLRLELLLELAADAAVVLASTAAVLVFLDWWLRFGVPVRAVLITLAFVGVLAFLAFRAVKRGEASRLDELTLAMTLDRHRPGTGQQIADVLQLPELLNESGASAASPAMVRLAVQRAAAALAGSDWRMLWNRKRTAFSACGLDRRLARAAGLRGDRTPGGPPEHGTLAQRLVPALAAASLSDSDGPEKRLGGSAGAAG